ncbi:MAG TPA: VOC family protein [Candidatus Limnocylindria bacterium]|nr:VOC family protein [Candidatus Limnocylindria bacterium]
MDRPEIHFGAVTIDCGREHVEGMARFYCGMLNLTPHGMDGPYPYLEGEGFAITLQPEDGYTPPTWPEDGPPDTQMHVDFVVRDIPAATAYAKSLGATVSPVQYSDRWHILLDPAGHPFCLCKMGGD